MTTVTAKEIQMEMLSAQEALIKEANEVLEAAKRNAKYDDRLEAMGFVGSADALREKQRRAKELDDLRDMYSFEYPRLKFIPDSVMGDVCRKYGLAVGHVSRYTGEVPEWALAQIEANKHHIGTETKQFRSMRSFGIWNESSLPGWVDPRSGSVVYSEECPTYQMSNLYIAAPIKDMAIRSNERVGANGEIITMSLDPIVSLKVKGGYIVLAAWGEEGQDTRVFNESNN